MVNSFQLIKTDKKTKARVGEITTGRGSFRTPVFMPVGTKGAVKTMTPQELEEIGIEIILSNNYHLIVNPGIEFIKKSGGLHAFMRWQKPILTDSGGYQVFSLSKTLKVKEEGVEFRSLLDGKMHFLSPEGAIDSQLKLGSDICMVLDECPSALDSKEKVDKATGRTAKWARRSLEHLERQEIKPWLFGIVQGGFHKDLRERSVEEIAAMSFDGIALGGLSIGEPKEVTYETVSWSIPGMPENKPRYLMGVGDPEGILEGISLGIDMFDSALPTRIARGGTVFTSRGKLNIRNAKYVNDRMPLDPECDCSACSGFDRSYIRYLYLSEEILALRLMTWHNLSFLNDLTEKIRLHIKKDTFHDFKSNFLKNYRS